MKEYLTWCYTVKDLPLDLSGAILPSANEIRKIDHDLGPLILKIISEDRPYIPRLKVLAEAAYSLFDWSMPGQAVTPRVCPVAFNILWRDYLAGSLGQDWRGYLYGLKKSLPSADLVIIDQLLESENAQRIALLDFIFLNQDRSGRNWLEYKGDFWALDNGMLWPHMGRYIDRHAILEDDYSHLTDPLLSLVPKDGSYSFGGGLFSTLYAGHLIRDNLLASLQAVDWAAYLNDLQTLAEFIGYPFDFVCDWRFGRIKDRVDWLIDHRRYPGSLEFHLTWKKFLYLPVANTRENIQWLPTWEIPHLRTT